MDVNSATSVIITTITGALVKNETINNALKGQQITLDITDLKAGTYLITVKNDTQNSVQRLIVTD